MKIRISATGRSVSLDIENQEIAEAVFNKLAIMLLGISKEYQDKRKHISTPDKKRNPEKAAVPMQEEKEVVEDETKEAETYSGKGFLYMKCPECGVVKGFKSNKELKGYHCFACGADTLFQEELKELHVRCECGMQFKYLTNRDEPMFDITCINCGNPVAVKWNDKKQVYETIQ